MDQASTAQVISVALTPQPLTENILKSNFQTDILNF